MRWVLFLAAAAVSAQTPQNVLLVVNGNAPESRTVADYYRSKRPVPTGNVCVISAPVLEEVDWAVYERDIERPVGQCLSRSGLADKILYIVTTMGIPLKVRGSGSGPTAEYASVDSELTLLYGKLNGQQFPRSGPIPNPLYRHRDEPFQHPRFPIYLVTRLAAFDVDEVKGMIDRAQVARNRGKFVLDLNSAEDGDGNSWLRTAAILLPADRAFMDESSKVVTLQKDVIGYGSWGSNDVARKIRDIGFQWLPGAIAAEFVSTSGRTLKRPPDNWTYTTWQDRTHFFEGSPQGLMTDLIHQGATGVSGNAYEPFLQGCVRPDYLFPAYYQGRNLAESYYIAMPSLSWQGIILGDPLCSLGKP